MDEASVTKLLGEYSWMFVAGFVALLFKSTIESAVQGFIVHFGRDYDVDDIVIVNGRPGRITRVNLWKTVFFLYTVKSGRVIGGTKTAINNDKLKDMIIEKPLPIFDVTQLLGIDDISELETRGQSTKKKKAK